MIMYHHMLAYARFKYSNKGIIYSKIPSEFSPGIINHFSKKFPLFYVMIEHNEKTFVLKKGEKLKIFNKKINEVLKDYESFLPEKFEDLSCSDELWSSFYESQYIKPRKNIRLFHHFIPKKLEKLGVLKKEFETAKGNKKITDLI